MTITSPPQRMVTASALILTLWCVAILSITILAIAKIVDHNADAAARQSRRLAARELALTGIAYGLNPDIKVTSPLLHQKFADRRKLDVSILSENARLNINRALQQPSQVVLKQLFQLWGVDQDRASIAIDSMKDWTDKDDFRSLNGAERADLDNQTKYSLPQNRSFHSVEEMARVRGMDMVAVKKADWNEYFTVFGDGRLDIQDVSADLLQSVAGLSSSQAKQVIALRNGPDEKPQTEDDLPIKDIGAVAGRLGLSSAQREALAAGFGTGGKLFRIVSRAVVGGAPYQISCVTTRDGGKREFLLWEEW